MKIFIRYMVKTQQCCVSTSKGNKPSVVYEPFNIFYTQSKHT